ncbi:MAG: hypothetical protein JNN08_04965 [Bryobacterales bacterium]|nr:hypothetical protein [Bryobacterales bacterium]
MPVVEVDVLEELEAFELSVVGFGRFVMFDMSEVGRIAGGSGVFGQIEAAGVVFISIPRA